MQLWQTLYKLFKYPPHTTISSAFRRADIFYVNYNNFPTWNMLSRNPATVQTSTIELFSKNRAKPVTLQVDANVGPLTSEWNKLASILAGWS